jgi:hypothetical protein
MIEWIAEFYNQYIRLTIAYTRRGYAAVIGGTVRFGAGSWSGGM